MKKMIKKKKEMIINLLEKYHIGYDIAFALRDEILSKLSTLEAEEENKQSCPTDKEIKEWAKNEVNYLLLPTNADDDYKKGLIACMIRGATANRDNKIPHKS